MVSDGFADSRSDLRRRRVRPALPLSLAVGLQPGLDLHPKGQSETGALVVRLFEFSCRQRHFDLADGFGDLDLAWAGQGAVEDGMAAVNAPHLVQDFEAFSGSLVATVKDKAVSRYNGCRTDVFLIRPEGRAGGGAAGA